MTKEEIESMSAEKLLFQILNTTTPLVPTEESAQEYRHTMLEVYKRLYDFDTLKKVSTVPFSLQMY